MNGVPAAEVPAPSGRIALGEILVQAPEYLDRTARERERFALYSMGAFARGDPEIVAAARLNGKLARVRSGDVLLSRAAAEPRRAWVVGKQSPCTPLTSGEWLVLRSHAHEPGYLRHVLVSNALHVRFLQATAGGKQANPASARLRALELPLPSLSEQQAILRLLDLPELLRAKRRRALAALDELEDALREHALAEAREAMELLRQRMYASRAQLDALLGLLRDRAFRGELLLSA